MDSEDAQVASPSPVRDTATQSDSASYLSNDSDDEDEPLRHHSVF